MLIESYSYNFRFYVGELGIYFEDLYHLIRPLHDHDHTIEQNNVAVTSALPAPTMARRIASNPALPHPRSSPTPSHSKGKAPTHLGDPVIPPVNAYGTFNNSNSPRGSTRHSLRRASSHSSLSNASTHSEHQALHPSQNPEAHRKITQNDPDLVPFSGILYNVKIWVKGLFSSSAYEEIPSDESSRNPYAFDASQRKWSGPIRQRFGKAKHRKPSPQTRGENLPLEILRCFSEWCSVLEDRNTVPG